MTDIDFDELDRAVNSLMQAKGDSKASTATAEAPQPSEGSTVVPQLETMAEAVAPDAGSDQEPVATIQEDVDEEIMPAQAESEPVQASDDIVMPATKRSGRFMDVVHPSSDMTTPPPPSQTISRQAPTIQPLTVGQPIVGNEIAAPVVKSPVPAPTPEVNTEVAVAPDTVEPEVTTEQSWPDPIDVATTETPEPETEPATAPTSVGEPVEPYTPFLSDAKVEKRPLGGESPVTPPSTESADAQLPPVAQAPIDQPSATDSTSDLGVPPVALPAELHEDLVAVESDQTPSPMETIQSTDVASETVPVETPHDEPTHTVEPDNSYTGPVSIPQQYKEEASTTSDEHAPIYDTSTYHQPLEHPAKKKSGWLKVLLIAAVILIVGSGGAAALYYFGM